MRILTTGRTDSLAGMEASARRAFDALPEHFRDLTGDVVITVADWPTEEVLASMKADTPYDLLGLFQGIGRAQADAVPHTGQLPNMIWLYREPILEYWRRSTESLEHLIAHVLIHEIGHHFGLSDEDMTRIERGG
jgi:predicted Zn-dependent protease with MMP-like domain